MEIMLTPAGERRYAMRKVLARIVGVGFVVMLLSWALLIAERAAFPFIAIGVVGALLALWQGVGLMRNGGVRETAEGITNRRAFGYQEWRWDEIEKFTHVRSRVYLVTRDRRVWQLAGVNEGWRNMWDGGETREITALLNERLAAWQSGRLGATSTQRTSPTAPGVV